MFSKTILSAALCFLIFTGCAARHTRHGCNLQNKNIFIGQNKNELLKELGGESVPSMINPNCVYYINSQSQHLYFTHPGETNYAIKAICFENEKVSMIGDVNKVSKHQRKFSKKLKNQDKKTKGQIVKSLFEGSKLKM